MECKIFKIIFVLLLAQSISCQPLDFSSAEINDLIRPDAASGTEKVLSYTMENFVKIPKHYAQKVLKVCQQLLKDRALNENTNKPEIDEFRKKISQLVEKYEEKKPDLKSVFIAMDEFDRITDVYYHLIEKDEITEESRFIYNLLEKYDGFTLALDLVSHMEGFFRKFNNVFEENKQNMDATILDWYEKYITLKDMYKRMDAMMDFIVLAKKSVERNL